MSGVTIVQTGDAFPWQIATVMFSDQFARDRARAVAFMKGYVKASRHYFDAVLARRSGPAFDEVVAITAKYTGASPDLIRKGFPYQDRDGRLMPGDVARQIAWWHAQKLVKTADGREGHRGRELPARRAARSKCTAAGPCRMIEGDP